MHGSAWGDASMVYVVNGASAAWIAAGKISGVDRLIWLQGHHVRTANAIFVGCESARQNVGKNGAFYSFGARMALFLYVYASVSKGATSVLILIPEPRGLTHIFPSLCCIPKPWPSGNIGGYIDEPQRTLHISEGGKLGCQRGGYRPPSWKHSLTPTERGRLLRWGEWQRHAVSHNLEAERRFACWGAWTLQSPWIRSEPTQKCTLYLLYHSDRVDCTGWSSPKPVAVVAGKRSSELVGTGVEGSSHAIRGAARRIW